MPTRVQLPNGQTAEFPDGMSPQDIQTAIESDPNSGAKAVPQPSLMSRFVDSNVKAASDLGEMGKGAGKGLLHTISGTDQWARDHLPAFLTNSNMGFGPPANLEHVNAMATPQNTQQKIGYGAEQVGEFLAPSAIEKAGAVGLAKVLPWAGKLASPIAKTAMSALSSGAVNAAQGGSPVIGAVTGAGGSIIGQTLKAVSPTLTGIAQGLKPQDYQRTGSAILNETSGVFPSQIRSSARGVLKELNPQLNAVADASTAQIPLMNARQVAADEYGKAASENAGNLRQGVRRMANQLVEKKYVPAPGVEGPSAVLPIPDVVPARQYLDLKRGIGKALPAGSWNPESANAFKGPRNAIYGTMNNDFVNAVPEAGPLNSRISSLIPATKEPKNFFFGHALGPGVGATLGGVGGWRREGIPGAIAGAAEGGLAGMAFPAAMNSTSRIASSALMPPVVRMLTGSTLQANRRKSLFGQ